MTNQRQYQRISFKTEVTINISGTAHHCELIDLALQGALVRTATVLPLAVGEQALLRIYLPETAVHMDFTGELIHQNNGDYGFVFVSEDDQSMGHLRRLLELNFGDAQQANEEFAQWLKRERPRAH
jgi:hypothetical protein